MRKPATGREEPGKTQKDVTASLAKMRNSFRATGPQTFQLGDIVEVQVSFIAIPLRDKKWKISTVLRSISLFEGKFTQVKTQYSLACKN